MTQTTEHGTWLYIGLVIAILMLPLAIDFISDAYTTVGNMFNDGVTGNETNPNGWDTSN